jgi:hypothetical protein
MTQLLRFRATCGLALLVALALLLGPASGAHAAPADQGRIAVVVYPDLAGEGAGRVCPGCDRLFTDADSAANSDDPLPSLDVVLRDTKGTELERDSTSGLSNGRQVTFFTVSTPGAFEIVLDTVPSPWEACASDTLSRSLKAADFDATTGIATVEFFLWRGCEVAPTRTKESAVTATPTRAAATVEPIATSVAIATPVTTTSATSPTVTAQTTTTAATGLALGAIRGLVFLDRNADLQVDPDEAGVADVVVSLSGNGLSRTQKSAGAGTYAFPELPTGSYTISVEPPTSFQLTTPGQVSGIAVAGDVVMGVDFGLASTAAAAEPTSAPLTEPGTMPGTGVQIQPRGGLLLGLAAVVGMLGALGLALETSLGRRRSLETRKGQQ